MQNRDVNVGFSLDPAQDYTALADDIEKSARELSATGPGYHGRADAAYVSSRSAELAEVTRQLRERHDIVPFLTLIRRHARSANPMDQDIGALLHDLEIRHSYQSARYIGNLQGTRAGMILFYTDLLAKLWALDYNGIAPKDPVRGFRSMLETSVPKHYWDDFVRLSQTRLWFGLRQEGFDVYGDRILFQPSATRVYSASSDPLIPGRESRANYQSSQFLGWWDRHYDSVADYEPYYHKLNQIQKWGCIFMVLRENRSRHLDYLKTVPVDRTINLEGWLNNNDTLTTPLKIPFQDRRRNGHMTECLPLFISKNYRMMDRNFVLSGGVSLASRKDILAKLHKHDDELLTWQNIPETGQSSTHGDSAVQRPATTNHTSKKASSRQTRTPDQPKQRISAQAERDQQASRQRSDTSGTSHNITTGEQGTFSVDKQQGTLRLKWDKSPSVAADEFVATLAAMQQPSVRTIKGEALFSGITDIQRAVRVKEGHTYLFKTASTRNTWIYLSINPAKIEHFPSKASAAFPEADIFCAKIVSDADARKLTAGKPLIRKPRSSSL
jgi:hypothetical protein